MGIDGAIIELTGGSKVSGRGAQSIATTQASTTMPRRAKSHRSISSPYSWFKRTILLILALKFLLGLGEKPEPVQSIGSGFATAGIIAALLTRGIKCTRTRLSLAGMPRRSAPRR